MRKKDRCCRYYFKLLICIFTSVYLLICYDLESEAAGSLQDLKVDICLEQYGYTIEWQESETKDKKEYYLYLPYIAKEKGRTNIRFEGSESIILNNIQLMSGASGDCLRQGKNTIICEETTYDLIVFFGSDIPVLHVNTESGSLGQLIWEKDYRESGTATFMQSGNVISSNELEYIKGRGNSTWKLDKKPLILNLKKKFPYSRWEKQKNGASWLTI